MVKKSAFMKASEYKKINTTNGPSASSDTFYDLTAEETGNSTSLASEKESSKSSGVAATKVKFVSSKSILQNLHKSIV